MIVVQGRSVTKVTATHAPREHGVTGGGLSGFVLCTLGLLVVMPAAWSDIVTAVFTPVIYSDESRLLHASHVS